MAKFWMAVWGYSILLLTAAMAQQRPLVMASTPDVAAIAQEVVGNAAEVGAIMPAGADVHSFTISSRQVMALQRAALVLFANSADLGFEQTIKASLGKTPLLDWPDYEAAGGQLGDYPGYPHNPHGPWLRLDNAKAMGKAIAAKLIALGLPRAVIESNLWTFERELASQQELYHAVAQEHGLRDKPLLVVIPGLCDLVANLGVPVGGVLMAEGSGTVSGRQLATAVAALKSGQYGGLVCPLSMAQSRQGEAARQVARDAGAPIAYVRFQDTDLQRDTYLSVAAYNATALAALSGTPRHAAAVRLPNWLLPALAILAGLVVGLLIGLKTRCKPQPISGAGIFDEQSDQ